jgi:hypothetical protein
MVAMLDAAATILTIVLIGGTLWALDKLDERPKHLLSARTRWIVCGTLALGGIVWAIVGAATGATWGFALLLTAPLFVMILRRTDSSFFGSGPRDGGTGFYGGP